ncbi:heme biosynthesis protein HemY, partial [Burkholderia cenocepacia]
TEQQDWAVELQDAMEVDGVGAPDAAAAVRQRRQGAQDLPRERGHYRDAVRDGGRSLSPVERQARSRGDLAAELVVPRERRKGAGRIVEDARAHKWDARLLRRYPETAGADALALIQRAEGWKKDHPEDADLLFAVGRRCQQQQLGGKAESFLESALK